MKNKSIVKSYFIKLFSGVKIFLLIFFLGSSVFASSDGQILSETPVQEKKDLSVFVSRLSERLQGVFKEIVSLSSDQKFFAVASSGSQQEAKKTLLDIDDTMYEPEILALADLGVVDASRQKFYPDNYLRRYEFVIMMVKYRLAKSNTHLSPVVFPLRGWFFDVAQNTSYAPYVAYAEQQGWVSSLITQKDDKKLFIPNKFLKKVEVCALLELDLSHAFCTKDLIKRGEFAGVLLRGFRSAEDYSSAEKQLTTPSQTTTSSEPLVHQVKSLFSFVQ